MIDDSKPLLIRADAGGTLGTGHVMRMIALAQAWQDRGGTVTIAAIQCPLALVTRLESEYIHFVALGDHPLAGGEDSRKTIELGEAIGAEWIVLDGYHFGESYQQALKSRGFRILAIDDYAHCSHSHSDLVLNQNVYAEGFAYPSLGENTSVLRGAEYALLRREFLEQPPLKSGATRVPGRLDKLLLSFGGVDPDNVTGGIIAILNGLRRFPLTLRVLLGAGNTHRDPLARAAAESPHKIEFLSNVTDMPAQYGWADGIIGAGGSTCLEWLYYELPAAVVRLADNQNLVVDTLASLDRCLDLGWHADIGIETYATRVSNWIDHGASSASYGAVRVDGCGAARVAARLDNRLRLRKATADDRTLYFVWANDPDVRNNALNREPIRWEDHCQWFSSKLESPDARLYLCLDEHDHPIGQTRFERKSGSEWEIDYSVDASRRGKGIGLGMLSLAIRVFRRDEKHPLLAIVRNSNAASSAIFRKLGFTACENPAEALTRFRS